MSDKVLSRKEFSGFFKSSVLYEVLNLKDNDVKEAYLNLKTGEFIMLLENKLKRKFSDNHSITSSYNTNHLNVFKVEDSLYREQLYKLGLIESLNVSIEGEISSSKKMTI